MKLLLFSDRITTKNIIQLWVKKRKPHIAWVITAAKASTNANYLNRTLQPFLSSDFPITLYDIENKTYSDFEKDLKDIDILLVDGGNPFYLLKSIKESGFDKFIKKWVKTKPYIGVSAGSYIVCPTIEMSIWIKPNRKRFGVKNLNALGLVDFLVKAHYSSEYKEIIATARANSKYPIKVLRNGQALLINDQQITILSDKDGVKL